MFFIIVLAHWSVNNICKPPIYHPSPSTNSTRRKNKNTWKLHARANVFKIAVPLWSDKSYLKHTHTHNKYMSQQSNGSFIIIYYNSLLFLSLVSTTTAFCHICTPCSTHSLTLPERSYQTQPPFTCALKYWLELTVLWTCQERPWSSPILSNLSQLLAGLHRVEMILG